MTRTDLAAGSYFAPPASGNTAYQPGFRHAHQPEISIKEIQEGPSTTSFVFLVMLVLVMLPMAVGRPGLGSIGSGAVDNLVETTAIDPHAPALGTVIDLDTEAVGHHQLKVACWAVHAMQQCN